MSRDDYTKFSKKYEELKIFKADPFQTIDQEGVGKLIEQAVKLGRTTNPNLEIGICGEHGGDPSSVEFCYRVGMDYVSCSPYRVPIARLAAAQAAISGGDKSEAMRTGVTHPRRVHSVPDPGGFSPGLYSVGGFRLRLVIAWLRLRGSSSLSCPRRRQGLSILLFPSSPRPLTLGGARVQVFFGKLLAVGGGIDGVLQSEFVARQILRARILDLLQCRQHFAFGGGHFLHAFIERRLADQRIVGHRVDGLDDVRVIFQRVVNQRRAPGLFLAQKLLQKGQPLPREQNVQLQPRVGFLHFPDLIHFVRRQEVALLREARQRASTSKIAKYRMASRLLTLYPLLLAHDIGKQLVMNVRNLLQHRLDRRPEIKAHFVAKAAQPAHQRAHLQFGALVILALARRAAWFVRSAS